MTPGAAYAAKQKYSKLSAFDVMILDLFSAHNIGGEVYRDTVNYYGLQPADMYAVMVALRELQILKAKIEKR